MQKILIASLLYIFLVSCTPIEVPITEVTSFPIFLRTDASQTASRNQANGFAFITGYSNEQTKITVTLIGLVPKSVHAGQIRYGECVDPNLKVLVPLNQIQANEYGDGRVDTFIPTKKFEENRTKGLKLTIVYLQRSETDPKTSGDPIVCGDFKYR